MENLTTFTIPKSEDLKNDPTDPLNMNSTLIVSGMIFLISFFFCLIPRAVHKVKMISRAVPYATLLSAGFLLAVLILDFIPHMFEHKEHEDHEKQEFKQKIALLVSGFSFIFLLGIDSVILKHDHCEDNEHEHHHHEESERVKKGKTEEPVMQDTGVERIEIDETVVKRHDHAKHSHGEEEGGCCNMDVIKKTNSMSKAFIFIIGISIHSFFEGLAFKCSSDKIFGSYEISILLHKILESFSIGLAFIGTAFSEKITLFLITFYSILTPLGMLIGLKFNNADEYKIGEIPVFILFEGLALGSLMFIVFIEMIAAAIHKPGNNLIRLAVITFGFITGSALIMGTPHSHTHSHSHH